MTNYIASELTDRYSRDVDRKEMVDFIRGYSDKELIESAQSYNASNIGDRIRESLLPIFRTQERDIARNILSEKGIDYKIKANSGEICINSSSGKSQIKERESKIQKEKTKQKMKKLGDFMKNINLFNIL